MYSFPNKKKYDKDVYKLQDALAEELYNSIKQSDTDVSQIAKNVWYKPHNVLKIKEHVFIQSHYLDLYAKQNPNEPIEFKRLIRIFVKHGLE